jgi:RimJ/RimL family protein N-acetyltransferase
MLTAALSYSIYRGTVIQHPVVELRTERLLLRGWRDGDREPFAALNADAEVMEHFPAPLTRSESDALVEMNVAHFSRHPFGLWAVEVVDSGTFIGFTGLAEWAFEAHFMPAVEVGWRLARPAWGHGYATEAARAALAFGFEVCDLDEIVSFTSVPNTRSRAVMARLGLTRDPADDFDHPKMPSGHRLERHVLYRLDRTTWLAGLDSPQ